jgi:hypothetical protein
MVIYFDFETLIGRIMDHRGMFCSSVFGYGHKKPILGHLFPRMLFCGTRARAVPPGVAVQAGVALSRTFSWKIFSKKNIERDYTGVHAYTHSRKPAVRGDRIGFAMEIPQKYL